MKKSFITLSLFLMFSVMAGGKGHYYGYGESNLEALEEVIIRIKEDNCKIKAIDFNKLKETNIEGNSQKAIATVFDCDVDPDDWP